MYFISKQNRLNAWTNFNNPYFINDNHVNVDDDNNNKSNNDNDYNNNNNNNNNNSNK